MVTLWGNYEGISQRYAWYCQQMMQARELELEH
ncbi:TPA: hypothetical protein ACGR3P_004664 [Escherichia coli]